MRQRQSRPSNRLVSAPRNWIAAGVLCIVVDLILLRGDVLPLWSLIPAVIVGCAMIVYAQWLRYRLVTHVLHLQECLCLSCGYDLRGIPSPGTCPECSCPFDSSDVRMTWNEWITPPVSGLARSEAADPPVVQRLQSLSRLLLLGIPLGILVSIWCESGIGLVLSFGGPIAASVLLMGIRSSGLMGEANRARFQLCTHCGYDMRNVREGTCPECGKPYNRENAVSSWRAWCTDRFRKS